MGIGTVVWADALLNHWFVQGLLLCAAGAFVGLGKSLMAAGPLSRRAVAGRVILGAMTSLVAGGVLLTFSDAHPLAFIGIGSGLALLGVHFLERIMDRWLK